MVLDPRKTDGLPAPDAKFLNIVKDFGWHVMKVTPRAGEGEDFWAYSTGLTYSYGHPEILIFNLRPEVMHHLINVVGNKVKSGQTYRPNETYTDLLEGYRCAFRPVLPVYYQQYVGFSRWFYEGDSFSMLQCFWPDRDHRFPWDRDCDSGVISSQPLLYLPPSTR